MTALSILIVHHDLDAAKALCKRVDWDALGVHLAGLVGDGKAALTLMGQQKFGAVLVDMDARCQGEPILSLAANYPQVLFLPIIPGDPPPLLTQLPRQENICDYICWERGVEEVKAALERTRRRYHKLMLATAAEQLMDLSVFDVPEGLKRNVRSSMRTVVKSTVEGDLNALAQDVSILFQETLRPYCLSDIAFSKATTIELISQLRYYLFSQGLNVDEEFSPAVFIRKIQDALTNDDLEDLCLYYLRRGIGIIHPNSTSSQMSALVRTAIKITRQRYSDPAFSLVSLSDEIGITPNYLSSVFKMETGIRFKKYLNSYRIDQAKLLLADSRYKIYEVANLVGIEDSRYFSQIFRTYTGLKPSDYRNVRAGDETEGEA